MTVVTHAYGIIRPLLGEVLVPSDKSLVHRAVLFASIAEGNSVVRTNDIGRDNLATIRVMQQLGVSITCRLASRVFTMAGEEGIKNISQRDLVSNVPSGSISESICELEIEGRGLRGLRECAEILNCGNSGTTARLLLGVLAAAQIKATIDGDSSLRKRPFRRVTEPLSLMGARFDGDSLPLSIECGVSMGIAYRSPKASAQVKSAILLAGLGLANGTTTGETNDFSVTVSEPVLSRDHTEIMLGLMGCGVVTAKQADGSALVQLPLNLPERVITGVNLDISGDFSAASFILAAASLVPGSDVMVKGVGFNPTRIGFYELLKRMGAKIDILNSREVSGEVVVDLRVQSSRLSGVHVSPEEVVYAIDEVPILAVCAAFAEGETVIRGAEELRVKESDRLSLMTSMLRSAGFEVEELRDGMRIVGNPSRMVGGQSEPQSIDSGLFEGKGDHRIAMCATIFEYLLTGQLMLVDKKETETSFPGFGDVLSRLIT